MEYQAEWNQDGSKKPVVECKHCGKEIIKVVNRWYHFEGGKWTCKIIYATPKLKEAEDED